MAPSARGGGMKYHRHKCYVILVIFWLTFTSLMSTTPEIKKMKIKILTHISLFLLSTQYYTGPTLGVLLFSNYLWKSLIGLSIKQVACYKSDELSNFQLPYWRKNSIFFSCCKIHQSQSKTVNFSTKSNQVYTLFRTVKICTCFLYNCFMVLWLLKFCPLKSFVFF